METMEGKVEECIDEYTQLCEETIEKRYGDSEISSPNAEKTLKRPYNSFFLYYLGKHSSKQGQADDDEGNKKLKIAKEAAKEWHNLPEELKKPFKEASKKAFKEHAQNNPKEDKPIKVYLETRCATRRFAELVSQFGSDKINCIKDLGFGGLVHLKVHYLRLKLIEDLMQRFDVTTCELDVHGRKLKLTVTDVERILGLKASGYNINVSNNQDDNDLRVKYNLSIDKVKVRDLCKELICLPVGEEFKAKFLLYVVSSIIRPTTNAYVSSQAFYLLKDLSTVKQLNWAKFTLEGLCTGVKKFHKIDFSDGKNKCIAGCLLLLKMFYLDKIGIGLMSMPSGQQLYSRIRIWDDSMIGNLWKKIQDLGGVGSDKVLLLHEDEENNATQNLSNDASINEDAGILELRKDFVQLEKTITCWMEGIEERIFNEFTTIKDLLKNLFMQKESKSIEDHVSKEESRGDHSHASHCNQKNIEADVTKSEKVGDEEIGLKAKAEAPFIQISSLDQHIKYPPNYGIAASNIVRGFNYGIHPIESVGAIHSKHRSKATNRYALRSAKVLKKSRAVTSPYVYKLRDEPTAEWRVESILEDKVSDICSYVFSSKLQDSEILCDMGNRFANRKEFKCLKPREQLNNKIIDLVVDTLATEERKNKSGMKKWYLPVDFSTLILAVSRHDDIDAFVKKYRDGDKFMSYLKDCELAWLLDSLKCDNQSSRISKCKILLTFLEELLSHPTFYEDGSVKQPPISQFPVLIMDVFQQSNLIDCGMYVISYMRDGFSKSGTVYSRKLEPQTRRELIAWIVLHQYNRVREDVIWKTYSEIIVKGRKAKRKL